jgi:hypothetical protein
MKCNKCNKKFNTGQSLDRHLNRKFSCIKETDFKCNNCNKNFKYKKNLLEHTTKDICKKIETIQNDNISNALIDIINNDISMDDKIFCIKKFNTTLNDDEIKRYINLKVCINTKIALLTNVNKSNSGVTNITNNTTNTTNNNNIQINFDNENISYLTKSYYEKLLNNNFPENIVLQLSNEIYLNKNHPENQTIKINNLKNNLCKIKEEDKWITSSKDDALKKIINKMYNIIAEVIDENEGIISENKTTAIFEEYLDKEFDDEIIKETVKKLVLKIYNFHNNIV